MTEGQNLPMLLPCLRLDIDPGDYIAAVHLDGRSIIAISAAGQVFRFHVVEAGWSRPGAETGDSPALAPEPSPGGMTHDWVQTRNKSGWYVEVCAYCLLEKRVGISPYCSSGRRSADESSAADELKSGLAEARTMLDKMTQGGEAYRDKRNPNIVDPATCEHVWVGTRDGMGNFSRSCGICGHRSAEVDQAPISPLVRARAAGEAPSVGRSEAHVREDERGGGKRDE